MAVPKQKLSKRRKRIRRSHMHLTPTTLARCSRCGAPTRPHAVCDACGFYKGIAVKVDSSSNAASA